MRFKMKQTWKHWQWALVLLLTICTYSCKDDNETEVAPFDPSKEVVITGFTPESGGAHQQMLIYGQNFGNDKSIVSVKIGGIEAIVISVNGSNIYCFVPQKAYSGEVEVTIGTGDKTKVATAPKTFAYTRELMVGTLCGSRNQHDDLPWKPGPFSEATGFRSDSYMKFDPLNPDHLYISYDGHNQIQVIDLAKKEVRNVMSTAHILSATSRVRSIDFTKAAYGKAEAQYMVVSFDYDGNGVNSQSVYLVERDASGGFSTESKVSLLASYRQCNGASVHPNGEIYFNSYEKGQVFRIDLEKYFENPSAWDPRAEQNPDIKMLFTIADPSWEFKIEIHPSGSFAYLVVINQHYILRTDYNPSTNEFVTPYVVSGGYKISGYVDDVGADARLNHPYQGVFVKNPEYAGNNDEYDFYITDDRNHAIRQLTPDGVMSTFAGRGESSVNADNNYWGSDNGGLRTTARFRNPMGMAYDVRTGTFYIHDRDGRTIRTISLDSDDAGDEAPTEETNE